MAYNSRQQYQTHPNNYRPQQGPPAQQWHGQAPNGGDYGYQNGYQNGFQDNGSWDYGYDQGHGGQAYNAAPPQQYSNGYEGARQHPSAGYPQQGQEYYDQQQYDQSYPSQSGYGAYDDPSYHQHQQLTQPAHHDQRRPQHSDFQQKPKRERILPTPVSPETISWDSPFPTFPPKKKDPHKKHSSLDKAMGDINIGDSRQQEQPHTSHAQRQPEESRQQVPQGQRRPDTAADQYNGAPRIPESHVSRSRPPAVQNDMSQSQGPGWQGQQYRNNGPTSPTSLTTQPPSFPDPRQRQPQRSNAMPDEALPTGPPIDPRQRKLQDPAVAGGYHGSVGQPYLDTRPATASGGIPQEKPDIYRSGSDEPRSSQQPIDGTDPRRNPESQYRSKHTVPVERQPYSATQEMPNFDAISSRTEDPLVPVNAANASVSASKPAYQKATYQPTSSPLASQSPVAAIPKSRSQPVVSQTKNAEQGLGDFAFGLPSSVKPPKPSVPRSESGSQNRNPPTIQTGSANDRPFEQGMTSPVEKIRAYDRNGNYSPTNGAQNGRQPPRSNSDAQQYPTQRQPQSATRGPGDVPSLPPSTGAQQLPPRTASHGANRTGSQPPQNEQPRPSAVQGQQTPYGQQYGPGSNQTPDQRYDGYAGPNQQAYNDPYNSTAPATMQPGQPQPYRPMQPPKPVIGGAPSSRSMQAPAIGGPPPPQDNRYSPGARSTDTRIGGTPGSVPAGPVPVRPGLNPQIDPPKSNDKPVPVRQYGQPTQNQPSSSQDITRTSIDQQKRASIPVTAYDLNLLQQAIRSNPEDHKTALTLAKKLVEAASVLANEGGKADAKTTQKNREKYILDAHKQLKRLVGANYPDAMFYLADCYGSGGLGLQVDPREAFNLYQSAAKLNHAQAAYRVAVCCEMGNEEGGGTKRDPPRAVTWYKRAAALGDTPAMYKTGMILLKGLLGQPQNKREALTWLKRAADRADAENPHALHELGLLYESAEQSDVIIRDLTYARELFEKAAKLGYKFSQHRLASAYEHGMLDCPIDARHSIMWYSKAAAQGEHQSELALSGWYLTGSEGILQQSDTEAYLWARKAAQSGLAKAEYAMGYFTEVGIGAPASIEEAKKWYWRAAAQNFPKARERLEALKKGGQKMQKTRVSRSAISKQGEGECRVM